MNVQEPHEIVESLDLSKKEKLDNFVEVQQKEAELLQDKSVEERANWLKQNFVIVERQIVRSWVQMPIGERGIIIRDFLLSKGWIPPS